MKLEEVADWDRTSKTQPLSRSFWFSWNPEILKNAAPQDEVSETAELEAVEDSRATSCWSSGVTPSKGTQF